MIVPYSPALTVRGPSGDLEISRDTNVMEQGAREDQALGGVAKPALAPPLLSVTFVDVVSTGLSINYVNEGAKLETIFGCGLG